MVANYGVFNKLSGNFNYTCTDVDNRTSYLLFLVILHNHDCNTSKVRMYKATFVIVGIQQSDFIAT